MTYAGFDIGGTNARLQLFDDTWQVVADIHRGVRGRAEPDQLSATIAAMLAEAMDQSGRSPQTLSATGIGIAGQLDPGGQVVLNAPNLGWRDVALADKLLAEIADDFGDPSIQIVNDLDAVLWGEHTDGAVQDADDVLAVYVGTGVGGAVLADGRLVGGAGGNAGELGHAKVVPGGRLCGCGERGCVEAYAGGVHLEALAAGIAQDAQLDDIVQPGQDITADLNAADTYAADGHPEIDALWERATDYLAVIVANACTLLNPEVLLLGGGVVDHLDEFRGRLITKISPLVLAVARDQLDIRFPKLGDAAGMIGAAKLADRH